MNEEYEANMPDLSTLIDKLRLKFDQKMQHGESFAEVKKIYLEIKALESRLKMDNWQDSKKLE